MNLAQALYLLGLLTDTVAQNADIIAALEAENAELRALLDSATDPIDRGMA